MLNSIQQKETQTSIAGAPAFLIQAILTGAFTKQINHMPLRGEASSPVMDGRSWINADLCHRSTIGGSSAFVDGKHDEIETRVARELHAVLKEL